MSDFRPIFAEATIPALDFSNDILWPLGAAVVVGVLAGFLAKRIGIKLELYDHPDGGLKPHEKPVPYLGGASIFAGWLASFLVSVLLSGEGRIEFLWVAIGAAIFTVTGFMDDVRELAPAIRVAVQTAGALLLILAGIGREIAPSLLEPWRESLPAALYSGGLPVVLSAGLCALILSAATNASNLVDGMDGLCAGVMAISAAAFLIAYLLLSTAFTKPPAGTVLLIAATIAVLGTALAFLRFNRHPASMFMGDSGAWLFGFNLAVVLILFAEHASWRGLLVGLMIAGFPIFDTALTIGRRKLYGRPLVIGDRSHFYDQIRDRGLTVPQSVRLCYALAILFGMLGILLIRMKPLPFGLVFGAVPGVSLLVWLKLGMLRVDDSPVRSGKLPGNEPAD